MTPEDQGGKAPEGGEVVLRSGKGASPMQLEAAVAERDVPLVLNEAYVGPATVIGYTVVFAGEVPSYAIAICDTPGGERTVARSENGALLESMMQQEFCGRVIRVNPEGDFSFGS